MSEAFYTINPMRPMRRLDAVSEAVSDAVSAAAQSRLLIFGDHASKHIPSEFDDLGLSGEDLLRHIAWDIGTETIIRALCAHFGCAAHIAGFSRLVIDANRDPNSPSLVPVESDATNIVANQNLSAAAQKERIDRYYAPYHAGLAMAVDRCGPNPFIISVHSFTPKPRTGAPRETDIGLLVKHDEENAARFQKAVKTLRPDFRVEINQPYSAYDLNYTIDHHLASRGLPHLAIELRQDHVDSQEKAQAMAALLAKAITPLLGD